MPKRRTGKPRPNASKIIESLSDLSEADLKKVFEALQHKLIELKEAYEAKAREYQALVSLTNGAAKPRRSNGSRRGAVKTRPTAKRALLPKYQNPNNPEQTWSGQGRLPKWMPGLPKKMPESKLKRFMIAG